MGPSRSGPSDEEKISHPVEHYTVPLSAWRMSEWIQSHNAWNMAYICVCVCVCVCVLEGNVHGSTLHHDTKSLKWRTIGLWIPARGMRMWTLMLILSLLMLSQLSRLITSHLCCHWILILIYYVLIPQNEAYKIVIVRSFPQTAWILLIVTYAASTSSDSYVKSPTLHNGFC